MRYTAKNILILVMLIIAAILPGCSATTNDTDRVTKPSNKTALLNGTWKLGMCLCPDTGVKNIKEDGDPLVGEKIGFSQDTMMFLGKFYEHVSYKIKRVNATEYFLHKNLAVLDYINVEENEILVVTAYSEDKFLFDFIQDADGLIAISMDDMYYPLIKVSDEFTRSADHWQDTGKPVDPENPEEEHPALRSGLLLGVRIPVQTDDGLGDYAYGTYWISCSNRELQPVLYAKDIYLPRMDGFWKLQIVKRLYTEGIEDILYASMVSKNSGKYTSKLMENASERVETKSRKAILYVGNDYVCVENTFYDIQEGAAAIELKKTLRTLPIDNLNNIAGIKISDLAGENGSIAIENAIDELIKESGLKGITRIDRESREENFSLYRKTGHWFFKGRLNLNAKDQLPYIDFNLNLIPPADMVAYDMLQVPWKEMKEKIPQAVDIYTSPNKDLAVVLTEGEIMLYAIENKSLSKDPLAVLPLEVGSSVIMAEWAMGEYVSSWEKSFVKNNETSQVKNSP